VDTA
jgi:hypothetical protein